MPSWGCFLENVSMKKPCLPKGCWRLPDSGKGVINGIRRGEPLVFAHVHAHAGFQVQAKNMPRAVAAEGNSAGAVLYGI